MKLRGLGLSVLTGAVVTLVSGSLVAQGQPAAPAAPATTATATPPAATAPASSAPAPAATAPTTTTAPADAPPEAPAATAETTTDDAQLDREAEAAAAALEQEKEQAEADALAEEMLDTGGGEEEEIDAYALNLYGFVDFVYSYNVKDYNFFNPYSTFAVGRLNLYAASELGDNWRTLVETRFTYLPNGAVPVASTPSVTAPARIDTNVTDYTDVDRPIRWGGVVIERAWLEKTYEPWFNIRMGHWLTPYGIWNVDHGSPVIIGVRRPFIVGEEMFPQSQTGLELHGSYGVGAAILGYHLTLSNGRGPVDKFRDMDSNKAIGGRLYASYDTEVIGNVALGVSGYMGSYTDRTEAFVLGADGNLSIDRPVVLEYDEASMAADLRWTAGGFLFQSEGIVNDVAYVDETRPQVPAGFTPVPGYTPDNRSFGFYGLTGYRFDFLGTMPWVGWEYYHNGLEVGGQSAAFWGGLNFRPTPRVVLKAQYTYSYFPGENPFFKDIHFNNVDLQAAWSF